jgi:hypothetical protein
MNSVNLPSLSSACLCFHQPEQREADGFGRHGGACQLSIALHSPQILIIFAAS